MPTAWPSPAAAAICVARRLNQPLALCRSSCGRADAGPAWLSPCRPAKCRRCSSACSAGGSSERRCQLGPKASASSRLDFGDVHSSRPWGVVTSMALSCTTLSCVSSSPGCRIRASQGSSRPSMARSRGSKRDAAMLRYSLIVPRPSPCGVRSTRLQHLWSMVKAHSLRKLVAAAAHYLALAGHHFWLEVCVDRGASDGWLQIRIHPPLAAWIEVGARVKPDDLVQLVQHGLDELRPVEIKASHLLQARNGPLLDAGEGHGRG